MRGLRFGKSLVTAQKAASYYSCLRNKYSALLQFIECPPAKPSLRSKSQLPRTAQPSHKAASANPLGFVRAGCFESPAPLSAGDGASKDQKVVGPHIRRPRPHPDPISRILSLVFYLSYLIPRISHLVSHTSYLISFITATANQQAHLATHL